MIKKNDELIKDKPTLRSVAKFESFKTINKNDFFLSIMLIRSKIAKRLKSSRGQIEYRKKNT